MYSLFVLNIKHPIKRNNLMLYKAFFGELLALTFVFAAGYAFMVVA